MPIKEIVTILIPVLVALITGLYAYLQTRKTTGVEGQRLSLEGYESLNKSQAEEINRLREDRTEDQRAAREQREADQREISELRQQLAAVRAQCETTTQHFNELARWTTQVTRIFNDPGLVRILAASGVHVPPPPTWPDVP